jgi:DNA-binding transcriptional MerR regulator
MSEERKWLTINDLAKKIGIPHQTIRRYISQHSHHITMKKHHRSYLVDVGCIPVFLKIRELYGEGKSGDEIEEALANMGVPMTITVSKNNEKPVRIDVGEAFSKFNDTVRNIKKELEEQAQLNAKLLDIVSEQHEKLDKLERYIEDKFNERDIKLLEAIRDMKENHKQIAASKEQHQENKRANKKWWKFWG